MTGGADDAGGVAFFDVEAHVLEELFVAHQQVALRVYLLRALALLLARQRDGRVAKHIFERDAVLFEPG